MEVLKIQKHEMKEMAREAVEKASSTVAYDYDHILKFDPTFISDFVKYKDAIRPFYGIDSEQIKWLDSKRHSVKESILPSGVAKYHGTPVATIYPEEYKGFKKFYELSREDSLTILRNLRKAIDNNRELLGYGIYNTDFTIGKMLYLGDKVGLIGLDGHYIEQGQQSSFRRVFEHFGPSVYGLLARAISYQSRSNGIKYDTTIGELDEIFDAHQNFDEFDYPEQLMDAVEKARILK